MKKYFAIGGLALALGMAVPLPFTGQQIAPPVESVQPAGQQTCEEDQPCWDCKTDGNGVCGAVIATNYAEAYAICAERNDTPKAINECRWNAFYAFGGKDA